MTELDEHFLHAAAIGGVRGDVILPSHERYGKAYTELIDSSALG